MTDFYRPQILVSKKYTYEDIEVLVTKSTNREIVPSIQSEIQKAWQTKIHELEALNLPIWDGTTYRVEDMSISDKKIYLSLSPSIKYRELFTESSFQNFYKEKPERYLKHLSIAAIIETSDGRFVLGETSYPHRAQYDTIGGGVQENELPIHTSADLQLTLHKEIEEEIGILPKHFIDEYICGILIGSKSNIIIIARVKLNIHSIELGTLFMSRTDKDELKGVISLTKEDYISFCSSGATYRPFLSQLLEV